MATNAQLDLTIVDASWSPDSSQILALETTQANLVSPDLSTIQPFASLSESLAQAVVTKITWSTDSAHVYDLLQVPNQYKLYRASVGDDVSEVMTEQPVNFYQLLD